MNMSMKKYFLGGYMTKLIVASLLFLSTTNTLADVRNREKAKFDLISSIEVLVNIDECRKDLRAESSSVLPRSCNSLEYLSKYFFNPMKDRAAIEQFLNNQEAKVTEDALRLAGTYKIKRLGKITLSSKCVKNREPVDLDVYLNRINGITPADNIPSAISVNHSEPRGPALEMKLK